MTVTTPPAAPRQKMLQIEGLRAVAAILVAVFHIWLGRVSGGVDVFFVVAGYLITTTLLGHPARFGRVRPLYYLARLARRLLPASMVVITVVVTATFFFLPANDWLQSMREALASAFYGENWLLAAESVDYLAKDAFHSPVQNFWAMSVQGQFYLIWLGLFAVIGFAAAAAKKRVNVVLATLVVLFAVSIVYSVIVTGADQAFAYYNTFARVWEFALGGIGAIVIPRLKVPQLIRSALGWIGLAGVVSCGFLLQVSQVFPGYAALWPTVSALLVIIGGTAGSRLTAGRLLSTRPLVWLGSISYGIYLWHWPILVFVLQYRAGVRPSLPWGILIIVTAVVLAWLTKVFVENPISKASLAPSLRRRRLATVIPVAALVVVLVGTTSVGGVVQAKDSAELAFARSVTSGNVPCLGAASVVTTCVNADLPNPPIPADPRNDNPQPYDYLCRTDETGTDLKVCSYGPDDATTRVVIIGNSHAISWYPALESITSQLGWKLDVYFKASCAFNTTARSGDPAASDSCATWNTELEDTLANEEPYDYMLTSYSAGGEDFIDTAGNVDPNLGAAGFRDAWQPLIDRGTTVWAMQDTPLLPESLYDCYIGHLSNTTACAKLTVAEAFQPRDLIVEAATGLPGAEAINMNEYFCNQNGCPLEAGGVNIYRDTSHFTATWSLTLAPFLRTKLGLPAASS